MRTGLTLFLHSFLVPRSFFFSFSFFLLFSFFFLFFSSLFFSFPLLFYSFKVSAPYNCTSRQGGAIPETVDAGGTLGRRSDVNPSMCGGRGRRVDPRSKVADCRKSCSSFVGGIGTTQGIQTTFPTRAPDGREIRPPSPPRVKGTAKRRPAAATSAAAGEGGQGSTCHDLPKRQLQLAGLLGATL